MEQVDRGCAREMRGWEGRGGVGEGLRGPGGQAGMCQANMGIPEPGPESFASDSRTWGLGNTGMVGRAGLGLA